MLKFNLIFSGEIAHDFELSKVKKNFKSQFQLTDIQVEYIFSGKEIVLKKNLTEEQVLKFALSIDEIGGVSYYEPVAEIYDLPEGVTENRRSDQRRKWADRRKIYRAGTFTDRRIHANRRKH